MKNPIPFNSSVLLIKTDAYSNRRIDLDGAPVGTEIMIRPKVIQISTHRSDSSYRRCVATFTYKVAGNDESDAALSFLTRNKEREILFRYNISSSTTDTGAIVLSTLNSLAGYLATGMVRNNKTPPRDFVFITAMDVDHANTTLWEVWHTEVLECTEWSGDISIIKETTYFQDRRRRLEVPYVYKPIIWPKESCVLFCPEHLDGPFVSMSTNPPRN